MKVTFWGTRGSIPTPGQETIKYGGNTTCLELELDDGTLVIFDAGTGIKKLGQKIVSNGTHKTIHLFFTHSHWDHIQGFPLFSPAYSDEYRIKIYGCSLIFENLKDILTNQMGSQFFPVKFSQLKANISFVEIPGQQYWLNNALFYCIKNNHPGIATGFKVVENNKSVVFITDNELLPRDSSATSWKEFVTFSKNADLLIHDAHYLDREMVDTAGWGHSSYDQALRLGIEAKAKHVIFFHHEPDRTDSQIEFILKKYRDKLKKLNINMKLDAAIEGSKYSI